MSLSRSLIFLLALGFFATFTSAIASPGASEATRPTYPDSIVVLGHSGATGYNSDPAYPNSDIKENSWATGSNPAVNSIYRRILARNPGIEGHVFNVATDGSNVTDLMRQAREAVAVRPMPELFLIQSVDNDIHCDGTDPQNYKPFAATLRRTLEFINKRAPRAQIFLVSQWATVKNYTSVIKTIPDKRVEESGDGLCNVFDRSGRLRPSGMASQQQIVDAYHARLASTCAAVARCRYDRGALQRMVIVRGDLSPDANHLSIRGHAKMAAKVWAALY